MYDSSRRRFLFQGLVLTGAISGLVGSHSLSPVSAGIHSSRQNPSFEAKLEGAVCGAAIADGMGASVEGWPPEQIRERFDSVRDFLPPTHGGDPFMGKGDGGMGLFIRL